MKISKYKKNILSFFITLFSVQLSVAQEMKMSEHHMQTVAPSSQNIFLLMMDTMMIRMDAVPVLSVPDNDFMAQMIPHHEGAIEMAKYEMMNGKNPAMIQLAKSIAAEQTNDIQTMKLLLKQLPANTTIPNKEFDNAMIKSMTTMMEEMPSNDELNNVDRAFAMVMIPHHRAAIDMAIALLKYSKNDRVNTFAKQLISAEQIEIEQMASFIKQK